MRAPPGALVLAAAAAAVALAGCTTQGSEVNPNLLAPKLIVDVDVDGTPLVYVHSAFGERAYDVIEVRVDNETRGAEHYAYSLEEKLDSHDFFLEVDVRAGESRFDFAGRVVLDLADERAFVTVLDEKGEWGDPRASNLPYEGILDRRGGDSS